MKGSVIVGPVAKECVGLHFKMRKIRFLTLILRSTCGPVLQLRPAPLYDLDMVQSHFFSSSHTFLGNYRASHCRLRSLLDSLDLWYVSVAINGPSITSIGLVMQFSSCECIQLWNSKRVTLHTCQYDRRQSYLISPRLSAFTFAF
jgi:hypothetical protein